MFVNDCIAFDSVRKKDENGYLRVAVSNISREQVAPYYGREIPEWRELNLKPDKIYKLFRSGEELKKAADSFNGLPLSFEHHDMDAEHMPKDKIVGSLGTDARFESPFLKNSLIVTDADAIRAIESGSHCEISAGYSCEAKMEGGVFNGQTYDGKMVNIRGNHVALVHKGRAGHEVRVMDSIKGGEKMENLKTEIKSGGENMPDNIANNEKKAEETEKIEKVDVNSTTEEVINNADAEGAMTAAGLDYKDENLRKAFFAGMDFASKKTNDCDAKDKKSEDNAVDAVAADSMPQFTKDDAARLYQAAEDVAPFIGRLSNPFAFDSASEIYKKALDAAGVVLDGVDSSAFGAIVKMLPKMKESPVSVIDSDPINDTLRAIKSR